MIRATDPKSPGWGSLPNTWTHKYQWKGALAINKDNKVAGRVGYGFTLIVDKPIRLQQKRCKQRFVRE